ncbi:MAG TPA: bifunctional riboflavin kinase/FAD synthetase [Methylocella sp.]|nr:bifunctional riboflavin kinase/FAD synthetase [Methylocella sp.]
MQLSLRRLSFGAPPRLFSVFFALDNPSASKKFVVANDPAAPPAGLVGPVVAIGNFDGVHRGHRVVIAHARSVAQRLNAPSAVLTFEPHPADFFRGPNTVFRLTPADSKAIALERLGLDGMIVITFDSALASRSAEEFIAEILVGRLGIRAAVAGYDFHFGAGRTGSPEFLKDAGRRFGFEVEIVERVLAGKEIDDEAASSTAARAALEAGDAARAAKLLSHPFVIMGKVIKGDQRGRTLGFPTANLLPDTSCRLRHGVYAVHVAVRATTYNGVASFGRRPTFDNGRALLEAFLFEYSGDLYGEMIEVQFIEWIRPESKFDSIGALVAQMKEDERRAREIFRAPGAD